MEKSVDVYKGYIITTEKGEEKGIFFRSPIQKVFFDAYYDRAKLSFWDFVVAVKNPIRKFYEILLGNWKNIKNIEEYSQDPNLAGVELNILCSPIYFKREYRKLSATSCGNHNIKEIKSYGYESPYNNCSGTCDIERTTLYLSNSVSKRKKVKIKRTDAYEFTYAHIVKKIIDQIDKGMITNEKLASGL